MVHTKTRRHKEAALRRRHFQFDSRTAEVGLKRASPQAEPLCAFVPSCENNSSSFRASAPPRELIFLTAPFPELLPHLTAQLPTLRHLAASYLYTGDDLARIAELDALARDNGLDHPRHQPVLYHAPQRRPLHDVMTAIRHKTTVAGAGHLLQPNAERHLKSPEEMARLFERLAACDRGGARSGGCLRGSVWTNCVTNIPKKAAPTSWNHRPIWNS